MEALLKVAFKIQDIATLRRASSLTSLILGLVDVITDILVVDTWAQQGETYWTTILICIIIISNGFTAAWIMQDEMNAKSPLWHIILGTFCGLIGIGPLWVFITVYKDIANNDTFARFFCFFISFLFYFFFCICFALFETALLMLYV